MQYKSCVYIYPRFDLPFPRFKTKQFQHNPVEEKSTSSEQVQVWIQFED